jgi:hypothetical protein
VGVGVGVGVGLVVDAGLLDGGGVDDPDCDAVGLADGLVLGDELSDGDDVSDGEALADVLSVMAAFRTPAGALAASTTVVGTVAHVAEDVVLATMLAMLASTSRVRQNVPYARKAKAPSAPNAAGLMISGLTRATSLRSASRQDGPCCPGTSHYS